MPAYEYQALDSDGRLRRGVIEGDSARQIRLRLRDEGLTLLEVEEVTAGDRRERGRLFPGRGVRAGDLALVTRQMATLVRSGLPLEEVLRTVARQTSQSRLQTVLVAVRTRITEGHDLASALGEFTHIFPDIYRASVAAGEQSGHLEVVLERLADYTEKRQQMRQKIQLALFYPAILTVMAFLVTVALLGYVVPEVVQVFENINQELPALTVGLIAVSEIVQSSGLEITVTLIVAGFLLSRLLRQPGPKRKWHQLQLRLPVVGSLIRGSNSARFARTMSIVSASGVPILEALRISGEVVNNVPMHDAVSDAAREVREGGSLARALERSGYFPPMTVHLISSGEASGNLDTMLERAAEAQEQELEVSTGMILGIFEPTLILVMGLVVLTIVLAILLPIFELNQLVR